MTRYADVIARLRAIDPCWTGADWTHEYTPEGAPRDAEPDYCSGGDYADCPTCAAAESDARGAAEEYAECLAALERGDVSSAIEHARAASRIEAEYGDDPAYRPVLRTLTDYGCECGRATGVRCEWVGPITETVVIEWMPEHLRASHDAAGGRGGRWPWNGAIRLRVQADCADALRGCINPWSDHSCRDECPVHGCGEEADWAAQLVEGA